MFSAFQHVYAWNAFLSVETLFSLLGSLDLATLSELSLGCETRLIRPQKPSNRLPRL